MLDEAAKAAMDGRITREDYLRLWKAVQAERLEAMEKEADAHRE
jgi:hypothetical protein